MSRNLLLMAMAGTMLGLISETAATPVDNGLALEDVAHLYQSQGSENQQNERSLDSDAHELQSRADWPPAVKRKFKRYVALGDSYSAGPGQTAPDGNQGVLYTPAPAFGDGQCFQTTGAWPKQLNDGIIKADEFVFSACTGYNSEQILRDQILDDEKSNFGNPDLVSITVGGNNQDMFINVIKACPISFDPHITCKAAISNALNYINNNIYDELKAVIQAAGEKNNPVDGKRIVLVSGYPQLYNDKAVISGNCRLANPKRKLINNLSTALNGKLKQVVDDLNKVHKGAGYSFVDPENPASNTGIQDPNTFEGHRFCEPLLGGKPAWFQGGAGGAADMEQWKKGLFHPKFQGFTVMKEAAQAVLSLLPE